MNKIELKKIYKTFVSGSEEVEVLRDINFSIEKEEYIVFFGPSGAGKSTLINIITGLLFPTKGEVLWNGKNIYKFSEDERCKWRMENIGLIFQFFYLLPDLTVLENIHIAGWKKWGKVDAKLKAKEILKEMGLEKLENRYPKEISGGEQQRVAMGRAIINEPAFIFADEPTGNLDRKNGEKVIGKLEELKEKKKISIIIATHRLDLLRKADKVVHLEDGKTYKKTKRE